MSHIICVASQKGGTGKTTSAVNIAASLSLLEKDTLLVDCDPLGNATTGVGINKGHLSYDLMDALIGRVSIREVLEDTVLDRLQVIPARLGLLHTEKKLSGRYQPETVLRDLINEISCDYSYIIIDSPPSFGFLTQSAITASEHLILPLQRQIYSFEGLTQLLLMVRSVQKRFNPGLRIAGVFYTMCKNDSSADPLSKNDHLRLFKNKLFQTAIPWDDALSAAADQATPLCLLNVLSRGSISYLELAQELMDRLH